MKRALVDPRSSSVVQIADVGGDFPVAGPLYWADAPDDAAAGVSKLVDGVVSSPTTTDKMVLNTVAGTIAQKALSVSTYIFGVGGGIPRHSHDNYGHLTTVVRGSVEVDVDGRPVQVLKAGEELFIAEKIPHEIRGLEDSTIVVNTSSQLENEGL